MINFLKVRPAAICKLIVTPCTLTKNNKEKANCCRGGGGTGEEEVNTRAKMKIVNFIVHDRFNFFSYPSKQVFPRLCLKTQKRKERKNVLFFPGPIFFQQTVIVEVSNKINAFCSVLPFPAHYQIHLFAICVGKTKQLKNALLELQF